MEQKQKRAATNTDVFSQSLDMPRPDRIKRHNEGRHALMETGRRVLHQCTKLRTCQSRLHQFCSGYLTSSPITSLCTYPKVFPSSDLIIESLSRTGRVHHLSVPLQGEVGHQSPTTDSAGRQLIPHQPHGMLGRQTGGVVSDEGNPVADGVVSQGVCSLPEPASALVDVPVRARHEALGRHL